MSDAPRSTFLNTIGWGAYLACSWTWCIGMFLPVLLIRDCDDQPERRRGLAQASTREPGHAWPFHVVIGLAHPKREAWVLAGFEPRDPDEHARLTTLRSELGHDPCTSSDQLTARTPGSKRDAKRVVAYCTHPVLSGAAIERLNSSDLDELVVAATIPLSEEALACPRIRQLSVAELLAETIRRISNEESVSSLFIE